MSNPFKRHKTNTNGQNINDLVTDITLDDDKFTLRSVDDETAEACFNVTNASDTKIVVSLPTETSTLATTTSTLSNNQFVDDTWRLENASDNTKLLAIDCSAISTSTTRTLAVPDESGTLITRENASLSDTSFQLFDNLDSTKIANFQCSGITTATTRTYDFPDESGTLLTDADVFESGFQTSAYSAAPVAGQSINYSISRFRKCVHLHIEGLVAGTATTSDPFTTGTIIAADERPAYQIEQPLVVVNNGGNELGRCIVRTTGEISIFSGIALTPFTGGSGYRGFTVSWQTN